MSDNYSHKDVGILYTVENIPGPADSSAEYAALLNDYNSQIVECCSCQESNCKLGSCKCLLMSGGSNYIRCSENNFVCYILNHKANEAYPIIECNDNCSCSDVCHNRLVQKGPLNCLIVKNCDRESKGLGLFTNYHIIQGTFICEYAGELITKTQAAVRQEANKISGKMNYIFCLNEHSSNSIIQTFIDPSKIGNIGRYINHSCTPNAHIVPVRWNSPIPKLAIFASIDIAPGEEITFHYGDHSVGTPECSDRKKCLCNSSNCNGLMPFNVY